MSQRKGESPSGRNAKSIFFRRLLFDGLLERRAGRDEASIDKDCSASTLLPRRRGGDGERPPDYKLRGYRQRSGSSPILDIPRTV